MKTFIRGALTATTVAVCTGCLYPHRQYEEWRSNVRSTRFKTIATVAGANYGADLRLTEAVRQQLKNAGWNAVARDGLWDSEVEAVKDICTPGPDQVDGVLFVTYDHLVLYDCVSLSWAYDIRSSPDAANGLSLAQITKRLIRYLRGKKEAPLPHS